MKVESLKIAKVFSGGGEIHYILPRFQREYAWDKTNWQTLLDDIFAIYEIYDERNEPEHFMGALVVINDGNRSGTIPAFKLVDGQQRLTTVSIALCALGNLVLDSHPHVYRKIRRMLVNEDERGELQFKLLPTQKYDDRLTYIEIINNVDMIDRLNTQSRIKTAYLYLHRQLRRKLEDGFDPEILFLVFANCLQVVFIDLDKQERPFEIFESLNAKGKPLTQPDLVRNFVAMMLSEESQDMAFQAWAEIEEILKESRTVSKIGELTAFLRHYLAHHSGILPNKAHVYARFRDRIHRNVPDGEDAFVSELYTLHRFATYYNSFIRSENEVDRDIRIRLERLQIVESATAYPFMLGLFEEYYQRNISKRDLLDALDILENYIVRRFLANEPSNYTNKMFPTLLREVSRTDLKGSLTTALLRRNYPSDAQIQTILPHISLYASSTRERLVFILENINQYLSDGTDGYTTLQDAPTVEHIMPQKLTTQWQTELGVNWRDTHRDLIHTIGNLTLVTQNWNSTLSNSPWNEKQTKLARHGLLLNSMYFADNDGNWNSESMLARATWLTSIALKIWQPLGEPPAIVSYANRSPRSLVILGEENEVNSWRDVATKTMEFVIRITDDFDKFASNLQSTYLSREKRSRAKQLTNGWWLYQNLSANSVMNLCSRTFDVLDLAEEDWEVNLNI